MTTQEVIDALASPWLETKGQPPAWIWEAHQNWCKERDKKEDRYGCRYVDDITKAIAALLPFQLSEEQYRNLHGQVYNCNRWEDRQKKEEETAAMVALGWQVLNIEFVRAAALNGHKVELSRRGYNLLLQAVEKTETMRPLALESGGAALLPPRSRTRGYDVRRLMQSDNRCFVRLAKA